MAGEQVGGHVGDVGTENHELPVRHIDDPHLAEDDGQAQGHENKDRKQNQTGKPLHGKDRGQLGGREIREHGPSSGDMNRDGGTGGARPAPRRVRAGARLLVTGGERIGLHQLFGLVDNLELAVTLGLANAAGGPQVVVFMDAHVAFRRAGQLDLWRGGTYLVDIEGAGGFDRGFPQPGAEVGSLGHVADDRIGTPALLEGLDEGFVVFIRQALEVLHRGIGTFNVLATDTEDFILGDRDGQQGEVFLGHVQTRGLELTVEGHVGATDHRGEDHVRLAQADAVDDGVEAGMAEREVILPDHLATQVLLDVGAGDLVRSAWPDVVRADQIEGLGILFFGYPVQPGKYLLGRFLAGVDDVRRLLQTLIEGRIVEHAVVAFEDRQHRLARGRGPAAEHRGYLVLAQQLVGTVGEGRPVTGAVFLYIFDLAPEHTTHGVDLFDGENLRLYRAFLTDRHGAGDRVQDADLHGVIGDRQASGIDLGGGGCRSLYGHRHARHHHCGGDRRDRGGEKLAACLLERLGVIGMIHRCFLVIG